MLQSEEVSGEGGGGGGVSGYSSSCLSWAPIHTLHILTMVNIPGFEYHQLDASQDHGSRTGQATT